MKGSQANSRVPETLWTDCLSVPSQVPQAMARCQAERSMGCRAPGQGRRWWGQCWVLGPLPSQAAGPSSGAETSPSAVLGERAGVEQPSTAGWQSSLELGSGGSPGSPPVPAPLGSSLPAQSIAGSG